MDYLDVRITSLIAIGLISGCSSAPWIEPDSLSNTRKIDSNDKSTSENIDNSVTSTPRNNTPELGDVFKLAKTGTNPPNLDHYVTLNVDVSENAPIALNSCVSQSTWSFFRRIFNSTSATAVLFATVTPKTDPRNIIKVPIFITSRIENSEKNDSGKIGSACRTAYLNKPISYTYNSNTSPSFTIDFELEVSNGANFEIFQEIVDLTNQAVTLISPHATVPAKFAATVANPKLSTLAKEIDTKLTQTGTARNTINYSVLLPSMVGNEQFDSIAYAIPTFSTKTDTAKISDEWAPAGRIFLTYENSLFKSNSGWKDRYDILNQPISIDSGGDKKDFKSVINAGEGGAGFSIGSLSAATNASSLAQTCNQVESWLSNFLIPLDRLVAKYAIIKLTPYDTNPDLRKSSNCFTQEELSKLKSLRADYEFRDLERQTREDRSKRLAEIFSNINLALLSGSEKRASAITSEKKDSFHFTDVENNSSLTGAPALEALSASKAYFVCYRARPDTDLSNVLAIARMGDRRAGAIVSLDKSGLLEGVTIAGVETVAGAIGIEVNEWLDPKNKNCRID